MNGSNPKASAAGTAAGSGGLVAGKEEKKKAGGGVLNRLKARRQAPQHAFGDGIGTVVTEQELLALDTIRPEHVLRLSRVTESECCLGRAPGPRSLQPVRPREGSLGPPARPGRVSLARCPDLRAALAGPGWEGVLLRLGCKRC